ncbi:IS3 family transposase [Streptomyces sp. NBC_01108]|uniref:IS3 family transposase n=1 Tax=Streptomyces sp. NBC_01108 TaxID=2903751 RepID=UPI0038737E3B|nr:IS3 family transposase [Streptomyces sp. NBC_01108]
MISDQKTECNIPYRVSCRALGVSEAWFYKWQWRPDRPTKREVRRAELAERIRYFFDRSGRTYGSPRITLDLWEEGWQVSRNTVADIMAELGLQGRRPPRRRKSLTRQGKRKASPDLVRRGFDAIAPDVLWWGDMTEIDTGEGKLYLASVHDAFSRRALGYAMGSRHDTSLVSAALQMAIATRGGEVDGVIFHSDRGSEGGFNWSSQHLDLGGVDGQASGVDEGVDGQGADEVAWETVASPRCGTVVLAGDRQRTDERGSRDRSRRVAGGRQSLVPRAWRHADVHARPAHGPLSVV